MIDGSVLIAGATHQRDEKFHAFDAATGTMRDPGFSESSLADVADACAAAAQASDAVAALSLETRAAFLEAVASAIEAIGDILIVTAMAETGLPRMRLEGERGRTVNQLRLFASEVRRGDWLDVTIDHALPDRVPPRPDLRRMNAALGPVAVFGASNFPLAFSVAGGDTASAWAAGCPVVVKGHPAHPATGELVARAIASVVAIMGLPPGLFSYLPGRSNALGTALVADPRIRAVGFTGSRHGGLALVAIAAQRAEPIPVYAEMSSINPVILLPAALAARADALGAAFIASLTLGAGQFCTNPGLLLALVGPDLDRFIAAAQASLSAAVPATMLTPAIHASYEAGVATLSAAADVTRIDMAGADVPPLRCGGALLRTSAAAFIANPALQAETFGAAALIVVCENAAQLAQLIGTLEGQLTATVHLDPADAPAAAPLLALLQSKAGRVLANGWPTGVEVSPAMVHGGPFPATSDARTTSVGTLAMMRFLRPVCFQDIPQPLLPPPLQPANPWNVRQRLS